MNIRRLVSLALFLAFSSITLMQDDPPVPIYEETVGAHTFNAVNLRADPSTANPAILNVPAGTEVLILEEVPDGEAVSGDSLWYHVQLPDGQKGFIWSQALSEPVVLSRRCLTHFEVQTDDVWLVDRASARLLAYDANKDALTPSGETGSEALVWATLVNAFELQSQFPSDTQLVTEPLYDIEACREIGVYVHQGNYRYIAIKYAPDGQEIKFIPEARVNDVYKADDQSLTLMSEAIMREQSREAELEAQQQADLLILEQRQALLQKEKLVFRAKISELMTKIFLVSPTGGEIYRLTDYPVNYIEGYPGWSSDSSNVAYFLARGDLQAQSPETGRINLLNISNGDERPLFVETRAFSLSWSPDNTQIIALVLECPLGGGTCHFGFKLVETAHLSLTDFQVETGLDYRVSNAFPKFSPNGKYIGFVSRERSDGPSNIYLIEATGGERHLLAPGSRLAWSPDSKQLAIYDENKGFYLVNVETETEEELLESRQGETPTPLWSPDGRFLAFRYAKGNETGLGVMEVSNKEWSPIVSNYQIFDLTWSPDGTKIAFFGYPGTKSSGTLPNLYIVNVDGSDLHEIASEIDYYDALEWVPAPQD